MRLSIHDVSPVGPQITAGEALANSLDLARRAEELGYTRFWFAEHHNSPALASSQPALLIGQAAARTSRIRLGSGGVMLPNHSSLTVAEQFRTLEALYPGRIDLGLGRAPGTDGRTALALRRSAHAMGADDFPRQVEELLGYFERKPGPGSGIVATPVHDGEPQLWMLGSSADGAATAASLGWGLAFASHLNPDGAAPMLRWYRERFQPSVRYQEPYAIFSCSVLTADTREEVDALAAIVDLQWLRHATGLNYLTAPSREEALAYRYEIHEESIRVANRSRHIIGTPDVVAAELSRRADAAQADEIMVLALVHEHAARVRLYEILAGRFALDSQGHP